MADIDPTRLSTIFKTLSSTDAVKVHGKTNSATKQSDAPGQSVNIKKVESRGRDLLKNSLKQRLLKLKKSDADFERKAPIVAIQEILLWEFGDNIINHPDFNHLSLSVAKQVSTNTELKTYLQKLIADVGK
jgi:hypothetical protein